MVKFFKKRKEKFNLLNFIPFFVVLVVVSLTICFSAYRSDLLVSDVGASVKIQKDIRVTGVTATNPVSSAISNWEEYNVDNISSSIYLPNSDSTVTYYVTITNIGNAEAGISNISGLPSNLDYSISNYALNDILCDDNNNTKCNLGSVSTLMITIGYSENGYDSNNTTFVFEMNFEFYYSDAVARIGDKYYDTLQEAINDVTPEVETTIVLLKDTSEVLTVAEGKNIVLNMKNITIRNSGSTNVFLNYGTLKIINGTIASNADQGAINNYGNLIMTGGSIVATGSKQAIYNDGGNVEISGTAYLYSTTTQRATVQNLNNGSLNITEGTIISTRYAAINNDKGTMTIGTKDGYLNKTSPVIQGSSYGVMANSNFNFYDGVIKGKTSPINNESKLVDKETGYDLVPKTEIIDGSTYKIVYLGIPITVTFNANEGTVTEVTRILDKGSAIGTLPTPTREDYVFEGWFTADGDDVTSDTIITDDVEYIACWTHIGDIYVARIGVKEYNTLKEAIDDVVANTTTTIHLIRNTKEKVSISSTKNIIFDTQSYTLSNPDNSAVIENSGTLQIVRGTITSSSTTSAIINNKGILTISGGSLLATGLRQAIYNDGGTTLIEGSAYLSATTNVRATVQNRAKGSTVITGGTIVSTRFSAVYNEGGTVTFGVKDGNIGTTTPVIMGADYGITNSATFNFYDGIVKGVNGSISGTVSAVEDNSTINNVTEEIDGTTYNTAYLN